METVEFDDTSVMGRLIRSLGPFGFVAIDEDRVNIEDICAPECTGKIVRVRGDPMECITVFCAPDPMAAGCLAGWISEDV